MISASHWRDGIRGSEPRREDHVIVLFEATGDLARRKLLPRGRITERGRHEDLLAAGGLYAELYRTEFARQQPLTPARRTSCDLSPYPTFMGIVPACNRI